MKEGSYAVYKGKIYEADLSTDPKEKGLIMLISYDESDLNNGFVRDRIFGIIKNVRRDELTTAYYLQTYAKVQGVSVKVTEIQGDNIYIYSNDYNTFQKLDMEQYEPLVYHKWIKKDAVETMWEEKKPIWGFMNA